MPRILPVVSRWEKFAGYAIFLENVADKSLTPSACQERVLQTLLRPQYAH